MYGEITPESLESIKKCHILFKMQGEQFDITATVQLVKLNTVPPSVVLEYITG